MIDCINRRRPISTFTSTYPVSLISTLTSRQCQQNYMRRRWWRKRRHRKPMPVDAYGDHDMVCPLGNPRARHATVQSTYVRVGQDAGLFPRRTTVRELRRPGETG
jgi:hypothetical protein